jgi:hypothetical protein
MLHHGHQELGQAPPAARAGATATLQCPFKQMRLQEILAKKAILNIISGGHLSSNLVTKR